MARSVVLHCVGALCLMLSVQCASPQKQAPETTNAPAIEQSPTLGPGDVFEVRVYGEKELSGDYRVSGDGTIAFPLVGAVMVAGLSETDISARIQSELTGYLRSPHVSVFVKEFNSRKVFVLGEVAQPGTFPHEDGMSIIQAITMAGGFAKFANQDRIFVTRRVDGVEQRLEIKVRQIGTGDEPNFILRAGDIVFVPESLF